MRVIALTTACVRSKPRVLSSETDDKNVDNILIITRMNSRYDNEGCLIIQSYVYYDNDLELI